MAKQPIPKTPVDVVWSTDLKSIPKGKWVNETRTIKDKTSTVKVWHPDKLWIVVDGNFNGKHQRVVNRTYWIPEDKRWCMFTPSEIDIKAWAIYEPLTAEQSKPVMPRLEVA